MNHSFFKGPWFPALLVFLVVMPIYFLTLAPTFLHIDCGELATAQATLGISHPTGYPLFTILGYLFLKLPLFERAITQLNFLAALWTASGVAIFCAWLFRILSYNFFVPTSKNKTQAIAPCSEKEAFWIAISASLFFGFTLTVWAQATSVEVYSLHILLLASILWFVFEAWVSNSIKSWTLCALVLALGFSNHMTTLMTLPFLAFLYFGKNGLNQTAFKKMAIPAIAGFAVLAILYGFLFFRAGMDPALNWGNIHDWATFKWHLTGHQYQSWIMAGSKVAAKNLGKFLKAFPMEWALIGPVLMILGISYAFKSARTIAWAVTIGAFFNIFYVIQYDIKDLEPYFMLSMMGFAFFAAFGMKFVVSKIKNQSFLPGLLLIPLLALGINYQKSDQSKTRFFEEYTNSALQSIEPNAFVMTQQWDFLIPPYYYLRMVEGKYPNIMVLDNELMRRSWYVNKQAILFDKDVFNGAELEKETFLKYLKPFEEDKRFESGLIEESYQAFLGKILTEQLKKRPVYLGLECVQNQGIKIPAGYKLVPVAFWLKLVPNAQVYQPASIPVFNPGFPQNWKGKSENAYYSGFIKNMWNSSCQNRSQYEADAGKMNEAQKWQQAVIAE